MPLPESVFSTTTEVVQQSSPLWEAFVSAVPTAVAIGSGGGALGAGIVATKWILKRLAARKAQASEGRSESAPEYPFPRKLDETRQLLQLRQSEGRVVALDALRGMLLDDEVRRQTEATTDDNTRAVLQQLMINLDNQVQQIAPISTGEAHVG